MKYREQLEMALKTKGYSIPSKVIDLYYSEPTPIKDEEFAMYQPSLMSEFKRFSINYHGNEIDSKKLIEACKEIKRKHSSLSITEISYCLSSIVDGNHEVNKFAFNLSEVVKVLKWYHVRKKLVKDAFFNAQRDMKKNEEGRQSAFTFLQGALKKFEAKEHLTVYERSAVGKFFIKELSEEDVSLFKKEVHETFEDRQKELDKKRAAGMALIYLDEEMELPVMWTKKLLFGVLIFEKVKSIKH